MKDYKKYELEIPDDFKSDGCTFSPDGKWSSCCIMHDYAKLDKDVNDKTADLMFLNCMKDRSNVFLAYLYYFFVRIRSITKLAPFEIMAYTIIVIVISVLASL